MVFPPPSCFTCGKRIRWKQYETLLNEGKTQDDALDILRFHRACCRRMFLGHVSELEETILLYPPKPKQSWGYEE